MDEPLFSKKLDDLLPPDTTPKQSPRHRLPASRPAVAAPWVEDAPAEPELVWWQAALGGGIAVVLITAVRIAVRALGGGMTEEQLAEAVWVVPLSFGVGVAFGLALWCFQWLKRQFTRSRGQKGQ